MKHSATQHIIGAGQTVALAGLGLVLTVIGVNALGAVFFCLHPAYGRDQGLDTVLFFWSLLLAPGGAVYGAVSSVLLWVKDRQSPQPKRRTHLALGLGYLALLVVAVLIIGFTHH